MMSFLHWVTCCKCNYVQCNSCTTKAITTLTTVVWWNVFNVVGKFSAKVLPAWCSLPVPAHGQSDSRWRLFGLQRRPAHSKQDYRTAVCRYADVLNRTVNWLKLQSTISLHCLYGFFFFLGSLPRTDSRYCHNL